VSPASARLALCAVLAVVLASAAPARAAVPEDLTPTRARSYAAHVVVATDALTQPRADAPVRMRLATATPWSGGPTRLLVLASRRDASGRRWLRVRLPARPNQAAGWISDDVASLSRNPWRIRVSTGARRVYVLREGKVVRVMRAVVGKPGTPTPHGLFAIYERARQPTPFGFVGPWALHLTAHSDVLTNYGGGPGRVALHGRAGASLLDPLGSARSHGCVRVLNDDISWLARVAPVGTPVLVGQ
jgi:lipoprotein-anchoring transpeptidase ErfK/SrfK